jgi:hypothetical protein
MVVHSRTKRPDIDGRKKNVMGFHLCKSQSSSDFCHIKALEETHIQLSEIASP